MTALTCVAVYAIMGGLIVLILNFSPTGGRVACFSFFSNSDVPAPAWPESPGFGLALLGSGFVKWEAKPKAKKSAWLGLALA